ncbi:MAG: aspartate-semialdehyde dehydrogenase [Candidatus Bathyarchaeia archaeon]
MGKRRAVILGATGAAGQNIVEFLCGHPWFTISCLAASERSHGLPYRKAIEDSKLIDVDKDKDKDKDNPEAEAVLDEGVLSIEKVNPMDFDIAFSALPSRIACIYEPRFAEHIPVVSTASAYRYAADIPLLLADVNPEHLALIDVQRKRRGWEGYIIAGPNCTTVGLVTTLKPLHTAFRVSHASVVSMQALSGAGEKGIREGSAYRSSVKKNVLPYIEGEEEKVSKETIKILGKIRNGRVEQAEIRVHATCTRVHVESVHTEAVHLGTKNPHNLEEVRKTLKNYMSETQKLGLPSAPDPSIIIVDEEDMPQPIKHAEYPKMVTLVGRLRNNSIFTNGLSYILTSDNLEKGAGGGAVLTAEYLYKKNFL